MSALSKNLQQIRKDFVQLVYPSWLGVESMTHQARASLRVFKGRYREQHGF